MASLCSIEQSSQIGQPRHREIVKEPMLTTSVQNTLDIFKIAD